MTVTLLTHYHPCRTAERRQEIEDCLRANAALPAVEEVVVFVQGEAPRFESPKIRRVPVRRRPTYADLLRHAFRRLPGRTCVVAHADIRFDETLQYFATVDFQQTCLVVSRQGGGAGSPRPFDAVAFRADGGSAWRRGLGAGVFLGAVGAEGRLAHDLQGAGFVVRDVAERVRAVHVHDASERTSHPACAGPQAAVPSLAGGGPKVIGVGLQRTGTGSLRRALNALGVPTLEFYGSWFLVKLRGGTLVFEPSANHEFFRGFADSPVPLFFREMDALFPGSRFILTTRARQGWLDSVASLFEGKARWDASPEGPLYNAFHQACYGVASFDAPAFGEAFDRHREAVLSYFRDRPRDLLVLDVTEERPWERLCGFLDLPIPDRPYPHANRLRGNPWIRWRRLVRRLLTPREELGRRPHS